MVREVADRKVAFVIVELKDDPLRRSSECIAMLS